MEIASSFCCLFSKLLSHLWDKPESLHHLELCFNFKISKTKKINPQIASSFAFSFFQTRKNILLSLISSSCCCCCCRRCRFNARIELLQKNHKMVGLSKFFRSNKMSLASEMCSMTSILDFPVHRKKKFQTVLQCLFYLILSVSLKLKMNINFCVLFRIRNLSVVSWTKWKKKWIVFIQFLELLKRFWRCIFLQTWEILTTLWLLLFSFPYNQSAGVWTYLKWKSYSSVSHRNFGIFKKKILLSLNNRWI